MLENSMKDWINIMWLCDRDCSLIQALLSKLTQWRCHNYFTMSNNWLYCPLRKNCPYWELFSSAFSGVSLLIQSECRKMWTRITLNTDTIHAVDVDIITSLKKKVIQVTKNNSIYYCIVLYSIATVNYHYQSEIINIKKKIVMSLFIDSSQAFL